MGIYAQILTQPVLSLTLTKTTLRFCHSTLLLGFGIRNTFDSIWWQYMSSIIRCSSCAFCYFKSISRLSNVDHNQTWTSLHHFFKETSNYDVYWRQLHQMILQHKLNRILKWMSCLHARFLFQWISERLRWLDTEAAIRRGWSTIGHRCQ